VALRWLNGPSRAFYTKCVRFTPTSLSTALSRKMAINLKLEISWVRRYDVPFHFDGSLTECLHVAQTVRHVDMLSGVTVSESKAQKDELILEGADIENVSQSGALVILFLRISQPRPSKASVEYGTKTFANS
jgi:hypothetical protein